MQIIVQIEHLQTSIAIEIHENDAIDVLMQMIQLETGLPTEEQELFLDGGSGKLPSDVSVVSSGLVAGSVVLVKRRIQRIGFHDIPDTITPDDLLSLVNTQPHLLLQFRGNDPDMAKYLESNDIKGIRMLMMKRQMSKHKVAVTREREINEIWKDPDNEQNQKKIEDAIRLQNIQQNMELAIENLPESFGNVCMLYVMLHINDMPIKAFVDSGAQSTIMSARLAERCGLMRLLDTRFAGEARGVGTAKILGKVHIAQMKFGRSYLPISITVLDSSGVDFLFGLDMLKRYKCVIDLGGNVLRINSAPIIEELPFLPDHEIPQSDAFARDFAEEELLEFGGKAAGDSVAAMDIATGVPNSNVSSSSSNTAEEEAGASKAVDSKKLATLQELGYAREAAAAALRQSGGDVDLAATLLWESQSQH